MTHAVVIRVKVEPDSGVEHRHSMLNTYVIPEAKALLSRTHSRRLRR